MKLGQQNQPRDRQPGSQDNGRDSAVCGVVGVFAVLAGLTRFLIATEEKIP